MKILLVSDETDRYLWDDYQPGHLGGLDLILAAGDLKAEYLSFLVTFANCPLLYVPGNHDKGYVTHPPEGCENIDGIVFTYRGVRFAGLGGCKQYNSPTYQYTEQQMRRRIRQMRRPLRKSRGVDVIVTHAAPTGCGDRQDLAHQGFDCFLDMMDRYQPRYWLHGHVHMNYDSDIPRRMTRGGTEIINAYERYIIEV